jgi:hypothetical protein
MFCWFYIRFGRCTRDQTSFYSEEDDIGSIHLVEEARKCNYRKGEKISVVLIKKRSQSRFRRSAAPSPPSTPKSGDVISE